MNDNNDNNVFSIINKLYSKPKFLDKYGGSVWGTVILCIVFLVAISYYYIYNNLQPIKADWINQRCNPTVMPFAGLINPPDPKKMSAFEFTAQNFTGCIQNILADIIGIVLSPIYYLVHSFTKILDGLQESVQAMRKVLSTIRTATSSISSEVMEKLLNILIPIQYMVIKVKDIMNKTQGIMLTGIYMLMGIYQTLIASFGAIMQIITSILISLATIMIVLYFIPFGLGLPIAIPMLIIFIMILVPGIMIYIIQVMVLKQMVNPPPNLPSCFLGDTLLTLQSGEKIKIKDVTVGAILDNESIVTSTMKLANIGEVVYKLNHVYCTGEHLVKYNGTWTKVKYHPYGVKTDIYCDFLYCINTSKKTIHINNEIFSDWDELDNSQIDELKNNCSKYLPKNFELYDIHKYLDGGFVENTKVELQDGHNVNINEIEVNNILRFGERVTGIVKIKADDLEIKRIHLENNTIVTGGPNLQLCDPDLGMLCTLDMYGKKNKENVIIYHLITDKQTFYVNGVKYFDYNRCIDKYIDLEKHRLLKTFI